MGNTPSTSDKLLSSIDLETCFEGIPHRTEELADNQINGEFFARINKLNEIGIALSTERDTNRLLEKILLGAKDLTNSDAGTLYTHTDHETLKFEIIRTDSLNIAMGGTTGVPINFPELPLYKDGAPNLNMIAAYAALKDTTINIPDAYVAEGFDFSGTKAFDAHTGYRSKSFLTVPLKNHENEIIGVLQLINAKDPVTGEIKPFSPADQKLAESLASQAAISMTNQKLIEDLKGLFEAFIKVIATAIDDKSPYTGGHCARVPLLAEMLAEAANESEVGELRDTILSPEQMYELKIAAWLHDCGKVTTPEAVVDKGTKLETIFDRIHLIDTRFEVLKRDVRVRYLERRLEMLERGNRDALPVLLAEYEAEVARLEEDQEFLHSCNQGGEFMKPELQERVRAIGARRWRDTSGQEAPFLTENEIFNLNIPKGTLTDEERQVINHHVVATIKMLKELPFPKHLSRVAEIAGGHHERPDGGGYPNGLTREQMSIQARILAIADVFEALTAKDRPYKQGKTLSQALKILGFMKKDGHIDPDLFKVFIDHKIYEIYARNHLGPEQIDEVDPGKIPGYA